MSDSSIVTRARKLFKNEEFEEAATLLLSKGYEEGLDTDAQAEYEQLFPTPPGVAALLAGYSARLSNPDAQVRLKAVDEIAKQALKATSIKAEAWMRNPHTTAMLTSALKDTEDAVHEKAVIALAQIAQRYFRDRRALPGLISMLKSPRPLARSWACRAVEMLAKQEAFEPVLPLLSDPKQNVRTAALRALRDLDVAKLKKADRKRVQDALLGMTNDKDLDNRRWVASLLADVGDASSAEPLAEWAKREKSREVKKEIKAAIASIGRGS